MTTERSQQTKQSSAELSEWTTIDLTIDEIINANTRFISFAQKWFNAFLINRILFVSCVFFCVKVVLCRNVDMVSCLLYLTTLLTMSLSYFSQAAEYNAALCIDWLTCMAPKNRMVFVCFLVTSLDNEIMFRDDNRAVFIWVSKSNWFCVCYATRLA